MNRRSVCRDMRFAIISTRSRGRSSDFIVLFLAVVRFGQTNRKWSMVSLVSCSWVLQSQYGSSLFPMRKRWSFSGVWPVRTQVINTVIWNERFLWMLAIFDSGESRLLWMTEWFDFSARNHSFTFAFSKALLWLTSLEGFGKGIMSMSGSCVAMFASVSALSFKGISEWLGIHWIMTSQPQLFTNTVKPFEKHTWSRSSGAVPAT